MRLNFYKDYKTIDQLLANERERWDSIERRVSILLIQGYDTGEIAKEMGVKTRTIKKYISRLFVKYDIEKGGIRRVKLVAYLFKHRMELCLESPMQVQ